MAQLVGQGVIATIGGTSEVFTQTTPAPIIPGTECGDSLGNRYVFCTVSATINPGQPVAISTAFDAAPLAVTGRGSLGVACARATSGQCAWVQVKGRAIMQIIDGGSGTGGTQPSPSDAANGPTSLATSVPTRFVLATSLTSPHALSWVSGNASTASGIYVEGLIVAHDASIGTVTAEVTATTGATLAHTGAAIGVQLNYPQMVHRNYGE